ncbi:hypothetical protein BDN71DRAFT_1576609 [Pleurotus eryngii]|uniref:Uncharacterized protein n=1 Tax=Pleurotus eryngii TaxID=5323 RepID=A0A9P6DCP0_PLEER|nr:hypothetical protein BDN71DRAFT_1576609 [Pleurotus eryngii]
MRGLYTKITTQFIDKYGYDLPHDEDASDTPPIIVNLASLPYDEQETEQERRDEIYDSLRLKIGNWLRHKYKRKQTDQDMVSKLLNTMSRLAAVRPRHRNAMNIYWAENYASSIKKLFDAHWKKVKNTVPTELRMSMCADFVRAKYEDETEEFRKALEVRANTEYTQALDKYNKRDALNGSPEAYAHAWNEAENFLPVFVDAVAKKFGMSVSLLLVGPLAAEEGNIAMRSVHSHNVGAMTWLMWPKYDNSGFTSTQESLIQYGEAVFSSSNQSTLAPEERRRRLGLDDEPNATDPMQLMDGPYQPSNEPDPDTFTLTDNRGIDAEQTFASGFFNMGAMQAHMPKTGFTGLMDGDWTQDMQFWNNAPNVFDPEVQAGLPLFNTSPLAHDASSGRLPCAFATSGSRYAHDASSGRLPCAFATSGSRNAHDASSGRLPCAFAASGSSRYANKPTSTDWGGCHCHCRSPTCRYPIRLYDANSAALLRALWSDSLRRHYNATAIALINPFPWGRIHSNHNVTIITSQWIPPSPAAARLVIGAADSER